MAELTEDEKALLEKHRAEQAKKREAESNVETWIRTGEHEATVPYHKAQQWLAKTFGIDLDGEPVQDAPAADGKDDAGDQGGGTVKRFGRRVG